MNDDELKRRFGELKARDAGGAPPFEALIAKRPRRKTPLFVVMAPVVAAAAAFLLWCGTSLTVRSKVASAPVAAVQAPPSIRVQAAAELPLDFLLEQAPITVNLDADPLRGMK